jgi:hypothetical protein
VAEKTDPCAAEETVQRGFKWAGEKYLERLQNGGYDNAALGELTLVNELLTDPDMVRRAPLRNITVQEDPPSAIPPVPDTGDAVWVDLGDYIGKRKGELQAADSSCEPGVRPVLLDDPLVTSDIEHTHAQGDDLHILSVLFHYDPLPCSPLLSTGRTNFSFHLFSRQLIVRAMSEAAFSDQVGIGTDTHVQLCFQESYVDDVCGPQ